MRGFFVSGHCVLMINRATASWHRRELVTQTKKAHITVGLFVCGAGTKSRTRDLLITSQLLYQLSYTG